MRTAGAARVVDCGQDVAGFEPFPAEAAAESVGARFKRVAARYPDRPALRTQRGARSYAEVDRATASIARALLALRGAAPESVITFLDSDVAAAEAFLGTVRAGKRYVPIVRPLLDVAYREPADDVERLVAGIWREVLGLDAAVGADDDFLDLGGDSLRAMSAMSRLRAELREDIPFHALLEAPTVAATARLIRRHRE